METLVGEFLDGNIEKVVLAASLEEAIGFAGPFMLYARAEARDPDVGPAELGSLDLLAHADNSISGLDHFHGFVAPFRIDDHVDRGGGLDGPGQNSRIKDDVGIQADERLAGNPRFG